MMMVMVIIFGPYSKFEMYSGQVVWPDSENAPFAKESAQLLWSSDPHR